jgi:hypothetical protein
VEVVIVLDPVRADDPDFLARLDKLEHSRHRRRGVLAALLWMAAPICIIVGGWTGLLMAVVAVGYGTVLASKQHGLTGGTRGLAWWSTSPGRHPL